MPIALRVENISKRFPGVQALDRVSLEVKTGEVLALVGENGAGKSTLMKILSGAYRRDSGRILLQDREADIANPHSAQEQGITIIYQEFNLTPNQTVAANIFLGREPRRRGFGGRMGLVDRKRMEAEAGKLLARVTARISPTDKVRDLSVAGQQMVEIVKALSVDARIIIMDEPTAALGQQEVRTLFETIHSLKRHGIAIIFITHRLEEVFAIADRIVVLRDGQFVGEVAVKDADTDTIVRMMVGRSLRDFLAKEKAEIGDGILEVRGLSRKGAVHDVSFVVRRGEILGVTGLVGAGRTETARLIFGADPKDHGEILIEGKVARLGSPRRAAAAGLALVPEDRARHGLVLGLSVLQNIVMASLGRHSRRGWVLKAEVTRTADEYIRTLAIRTPGPRQKLMYLSGGNQQKVVLAKWLASRPRILMLDEPTRGIDVGSKAEIHVLISRLAQAGLGILMISSDLPEILGMSDRIMVMREGRVAAVLDREEATQELIMAHASGSARTTQEEQT